MSQCPLSHSVKSGKTNKKKSGSDYFNLCFPINEPRSGAGVGADGILEDFFFCPSVDSWRSHGTRTMPAVLSF